MEIAGKTALVTGAGRRLGRAIALELAHRGAHVAVHYNRSESEARETVRQIREIGRQSERFGADLTEEAAVNRMFDQVLARFKEVSVLVNSAAVFFPTPLEKLDGRMWDSIVDVNLRACWLVARRAALHMLDLGGGRIVNIGCVSSLRPWKSYLAYAVSKAGLMMMTQCLALELAPSIQVNCVAPGTVLFRENATERLKRKVRSQIPAGHEGHPRDIAEAVAFLVTGPDYITGQTLAVDGGRMLK